MIYANILYPEEITKIMQDVLKGEWNGPNPEQLIDQLLYNFVIKKWPNGQQYAAKVTEAVKQLGCLDCVFARLNLECLLESSSGDKITIRYNRTGLLPGENHGLGCYCSACRIQAIRNGTPLPLPGPDGMIPNKADVPKQPAADPNADTYFEYPENSDRLKELEDNFYAEEKTIKQEVPKPQLSAEVKIEIIDQLRRMNYSVEDDRKKAYERLEKLLRKRSPEQNIIARITYLMIFQIFKGIDARRVVASISPRSMLPANFGVVK